MLHQVQVKMKAKWITFLILLTVTNLTLAEEWSEHMTILSLEKTSFDFMYEIKSKEQHRQQEVIIDCQSFFKGINFYRQTKNGRELDLNIYLDETECDESVEFIQKGLSDNKGVCMFLDFEDKSASMQYGKCD